MAAAKAPEESPEVAAATSAAGCPEQQNKTNRVEERKELEELQTQQHELQAQQHELRTQQHKTEWGYVLQLCLRVAFDEYSPQEQLAPPQPRAPGVSEACQVSAAPRGTAEASGTARSMGASSALAPLTRSVTCPRHARAGSTVHFYDTRGLRCEAKVPVGVRPGEQFEVDLPAEGSSEGVRGEKARAAGASAPTYARAHAAAPAAPAAPDAAASPSSRMGGLLANSPIRRSLIKRVSANMEGWMYRLSKLSIEERKLLLRQLSHAPLTILGSEERERFKKELNEVKDSTAKWKILIFANISIQLISESLKRYRANQADSAESPHSS